MSLTFRILDKTYLTQTHQASGFGVNPWMTHNRFLISQRLLIDETYTAPLRDWLRLVMCAQSREMYRKNSNSAS